MMMNLLVCCPQVGAEFVTTVNYCYLCDLRRRTPNPKCLSKDCARSRAAPWCPFRGRMQFSKRIHARPPKAHQPLTHEAQRRAVGPYRHSTVRMTRKLRAVAPVRCSGESYAIDIAPQPSCGLLIQSRADGIKLQQFIAQALAPSALMSRPPQAKVHGTTRPLTRIIAADIMPEHVMRQNHISRPAQNLGRLRQFDLRITLRLNQRFWPSLSKERRVGPMGPGPHPQVSSVFDPLLRHEHTSKHRERRGVLMALLVAVQVMAARAMRERRNIQRHL